MTEAGTKSGDRGAGSDAPEPVAGVASASAATEDAPRHGAPPSSQPRGEAAPVPAFTSRIILAPAQGIDYYTEAERESYCGTHCYGLFHCPACHDLHNPRLNGTWDTQRQMGLR